MVARADELKDVEVIHLHTEGQADYSKEQYKDSFHLKSLFVCANVREAIQKGRGDYIPIFMSEIPRLFRRNILPIDVALIQISPPDRFGYCSLGVSVDTTRAAIETAKLVIAQVNPNTPRTFSDGIMHLKNFDIFVDHTSPIHEVIVPALTETDKKIGNYVYTLIKTEQLINKIDETST